MDEFSVSTTDARDVIGGRYVVASRGKAIVWKKGNGTSSYMVYKTANSAERFMFRARLSIPNASIIDLERKD